MHGTCKKIKKEINFKYFYIKESSAKFPNVFKFEDF